jgi:hypothetical protein
MNTPAVDFSESELASPDKSTIEMVGGKIQSLTWGPTSTRVAITYKSTTLGGGAGNEVGALVAIFSVAWTPGGEVGFVTPLLNGTVWAPSVTSSQMGAIVQANGSRIMRVGQRAQLERADGLEGHWRHGHAVLVHERVRDRLARARGL